MIKLYLIRHAKSSWKNATIRDFDRPLNTRGNNDLPEMGNRLKKDKIMAGAIVSSPANRAITTAESIGEQLGFPLNSIQTDPKIYEASVATLLDIINQFDKNHDTYFMVGHNPGLTDLAESLSGEYFGNLPTCGIIGIEFPFDSWSFISSNTGNCTYYNYPKKEY